MSKNAIILWGDALYWGSALKGRLRGAARAGFLYPTEPRFRPEKSTADTWYSPAVFYGFLMDIEAGAGYVTGWLKFGSAFGIQM